ncbi:GntR family transcriptional regulator [Coralliovum pocilloporae]|uniref:GntR family transcriptional regulator n=1 Tax=Coralliovum pocilloporae TaxID=3066369 RepID=UPI003307C63D
MVFRKILHDRTSNAVVRQIESLILEGILRPGDQLPSERELSKTVDVSRPILREALKELEQRGLLVSRHGEGTFVADVIGSVFSQPVIDLISEHPKALLDYLEFRRDIEGTAAYYAASRATEADKTILTHIHEQMLEAHDKRDPWIEATLDVEFHNAVSECAHNIILMHTLRAYYRLLADGVFYNRTRLYAHDGSRNDLLKQHTAIYQAIMDGAADRARLAAENHMTYVMDAMRDADRMASWQTVSDLRLEMARQSFLSTPQPAQRRRKPAAE